MVKDSNKLYKFIFYSICFLLFITGLYYTIKINPHSFSWYISGCVHVFLSLFVYFKNKKNSLNKLFMFMTICIGLWSFAVTGLFLVRNEIEALLWSRFSFLGMFLIAPSFLHFTFTLTNRKKDTLILYSAYIIAGIFIILNITGNLINEYIKSGYKYSPAGNLLYGLWLLNLAFFVGYGLIILYKKYLTAESQKQKNQIKYLFIATTLSIIFSFTNAMLSYGIKIYPIAGFTSIIYTVIVAYAIVRYQLMDIEVIIRKTLIYLTLTILVTLMYAIIVGLFYSISGTVTHASIFTSIITATVITFSFLPLKNTVQNIIDRLFFKEKYDYMKTLMELSENITTIIDTDKLIKHIIDKLVEILHLESALLLLYDENQKYKIEYSVNIDNQIIEKVKESISKHINETFFKNIRDINEDIPMIFIPLVVKTRILGVLCLGKKLSEEPYTSEEIRMLNTITNQFAVAIENTQLYNERRIIEKNISHMDKLVSLGMLASSTAHEIKNPLTTIKSYFYLFERKMNDPDFISRFKEIVPKEIERMENFIHQLLDYSRVPRTKFEKINIEKVIDTVVDLLHSQLLKKNIEIIKERKTDELDINGDENKFKQVFMNLFLNAIDAMNDGGNIFIVFEKETKFLKISIKDEGKGIPEEEIGKIFNPFYTTKPEGTGLGLPIVKEIVSSHGGTIEIKSLLNKGTEVIIKLPLYNAQ